VLSTTGGSALEGCLVKSGRSGEQATDASASNPNRAISRQRASAVLICLRAGDSSIVGSGGSSEMENERDYYSRTSVWKLNARKSAGITGCCI
jgi:hypothetical protein